MTEFTLNSDTKNRWKRHDSYRAVTSRLCHEIPATWNVRRIKYLVALNPSKGEVADIPEDTEVSFLPMEKVGEDGSLTLDTTKPIADVYQGMTYFRDGDVLIAKITPCFENGKGALARGLHNGVGFGTTEFHVLRPRPIIDGRYLELITRTHAFREAGVTEFTGAAGQQRVPESFIANCVAPLPPLPEQRAIAAFLDRETARIDVLIAKKERLITLLEEKRQATITHAVTRGLDPNVGMKDSGIEWIGIYPSHWTLTRVKYLAQPRDGIQMGPFGGMLKDAQEAPTGYKLYGQENTINNDFDAGGRWLTEDTYRSLVGYELREGDIVLTRKGASIGNCRVVPAGITPGVIDSDTIRVRFRKELLTTGYAVLLMHEGYLETEILAMQKGAVLPGLNTTTIATLRVVLPPISEQVAIIQELEEQCGILDRIIARIRDGIDRLHEYRTALISAAVTGQIDVRGEVNLDD